MKIRSLLLAGALSLSWLLAQGPVARADTNTSLFPVDQLSDVLVDQTHGRVFVSGDAVVVFDLSGSKLGQVPAVDGARQLSLSPDGSQLLIATTAGIVVLDPITFATVRTISNPATPCPDALAVASGLVFFSYGDCEGRTPGLAAVDLATDTITTGLATGGPAVDVQLVSSPAEPNMLVASLGGSVAVLDTAAAPAPATTLRAQTGNIGAVDIALSGDGGTVVAADLTKVQRAFATTDLSPAPGSHLQSAKTAAVALRGDGMLALGTRGANTDGLFYYPSTVGGPIRSVDFGTPAYFKSTFVVPRGLAFGTKAAFAVTGDAFGQALQLRQISVGPPSRVTLTTDRTVYPYLGTAKITARFLTPTTTGKLNVFFTPEGKSRQLIKTGTADPVTGVLTFTRSQLTRNGVLTVEFDGDDDHQPDSATREIKVRTKLVLSGGLRNMTGVFHNIRAKAAAVKGTVSPFKGGKCVRMNIQVLSHGAYRLRDGGCIKVNSSSVAIVNLVGFKLGTEARVVATYDGDVGNGPSPTEYYYIRFVK